MRTEIGAKTIAFNPKTDRIFVDMAEFGKEPEKTMEHTRIRADAHYGTLREETSCPIKCRLTE